MKSTFLNIVFSNGIEISFTLRIKRLEMTVRDINH